jgi:hypothetical protein
VGLSKLERSIATACKNVGRHSLGKKLSGMRASLSKSSLSSSLFLKLIVKAN